MNVEVEAGEWLLKHGDTAIESLQNRINPHYKLLPDFAYDIFLESYETEVMRLLREAVMTSLNLNSEQIDLFFTKHYVIMLLGNSIFKPREQNVKEI